MAVDIAAVGADPERDHFGAQFGQHRRGHFIGGAVGAVNGYLQTFQAEVLGKGAFQKRDVAAPGVIDPKGLAHFRGRTGALLEVLLEHEFFQALFHLVGQFQADTGKYFDAVVLVGVVGGRNHHTRIGPHRGGDEGDARGRQRPDEHNIHPHGTDPGNDGILKHVT